MKLPKNIVLKVNSEPVLIAAVQQGLGFAFVSNTSYNRQQQVRLLDIKDISLDFPIYLIWRDDIQQSEIVNAYRQYLLNSHHRKDFT